MKLRRLLGFFSFLVFFLIFSPASSSAALLQMNIDGDIIVHDTSTDLWWISDLTLFANKTRTEQETFIAALNFAGVTTWELCTNSQMVDLWGELGDFGNAGGRISTLFTPTNADNSYEYFKGRTLSEAAFSFFEVKQSLTNSSEVLGGGAFGDIGVVEATLGAWVVASAGTAPVPEPATMFLLASGLVGLAGVRQRFKK